MAFCFQVMAVGLLAVDGAGRVAWLCRRCACCGPWALRLGQPGSAAWAWCMMAWRLSVLDCSAASFCPYPPRARHPCSTTWAFCWPWRVGRRACDVMCVPVVAAVPPAADGAEREALLAVCVVGPGQCGSGSLGCAALAWCDDCSSASRWLCTSVCLASLLYHFGMLMSQRTRLPATTLWEGWAARFGKSWPVKCPVADGCVWQLASSSSAASSASGASWSCRCGWCCAEACVHAFSCFGSQRGGVRIGGLRATMSASSAKKKDPGVL